MGWCCECVYCSIPAGRFINRGFLNGPLCPVYGFGALAVIHCLTPVDFSLPILFVCGLLVTSALEYFTGWLLETIFHAKWWDYSNMRFNIRGRVCLLNSVLFGLLGVFVMRVLHPFVGRMVGSLSFVMLIWFASALTTLLAVDLFLSVRTALQLSGKLDALRDALEDARARTDVVIMEKKLQLEEQRALPLSDRIDRLLEKGEGLRLHERLNALAGSHNALHRRMLDAFPHMQFPRSPASLDALRAGVARMRAEKKERKVAKRDGK
ncbi:membrane protein [Oscillospiraceae bacterium]|nr:membrane protein [Oscillospiraceae bacterium]